MKNYNKDENQKQTFQINPSTLETIDRAFVEWVENLGIHAQQSSGWKPVNVIWLGKERAFQNKDADENRDVNNVLEFPAIAVRRAGKQKSLSEKGVVYADIPSERDTGGHIEVGSVVNQKKTDNFQRAQNYRKGLKYQTPKENRKVVRKTAYMPQVIYVKINYAIKLISQYQQQMNQMTEEFMNDTGAVNYFTISKDNHTYEAFMQEDFSEDGNIGNYLEEERKFISEFNVDVLGHLIGSDGNEDEAYITVIENAVDVQIDEQIVTGSFANY